MATWLDILTFPGYYAVKENILKNLNSQDQLTLRLVCKDFTEQDLSALFINLKKQIRKEEECIEFEFLFYQYEFRYPDSLRKLFLITMYNKNKSFVLNVLKFAYQVRRSREGCSFTNKDYLAARLFIKKLNYFRIKEDYKIELEVDFNMEHLNKNGRTFFKIRPSFLADYEEFIMYVLKDYFYQVNILM